MVLASYTKSDLFVQMVDLGCAECKLLRKLKRESYIEQLYGVDIDPVTLQLKEHIVYPLTTDYLMPRSNPLQVTLMQGTVCMTGV